MKIDLRSDLTKKRSEVKFRGHAARFKCHTNDEIGNKKVKKRVSQFLCNFTPGGGRQSRLMQQKQEVRWSVGMSDGAAVVT